MTDTSVRYNERTQSPAKGNGSFLESDKVDSGSRDSVIERSKDAVKSMLPDAGTVESASTAIVDGIKSSGDYLRTHDIDEMSKDITDVIRRNPISAVWIGLGAGFLLGQALVRR